MRRDDGYQRQSRYCWREMGAKAENVEGDEVESVKGRGRGTGVHELNSAVYITSPRDLPPRFPLRIAGDDEP